MKSDFRKGDIKVHTYRVKPEDFATFESGTVHQVCSSFALGREMEWSSRLFVLDMKADEEEGIGTRLEIQHHSPAFEGEELQIEAKIEGFERNELICSIRVTMGDRLIASGLTGQKILDKEKVKQIFTRLGKVDGKG